MALHAQAPIESAPLRLETRPVPVPGRGEVLVRVSACGVCRTDLHIVEGDLPLVRAPIVPGHKAVGRVERGAALHAAGSAWDRVAPRTCGACASCSWARESVQAAVTGWHADRGYFACVVPEAFAYRIPPVFSDAAAAPLLCAGIIGYRALKRSEVKPGERLGIYGFCSSAHVTLQVARARGCEVYVCTREASHRELARRLGAAWVGDLPDAMPAKVTAHRLRAGRRPGAARRASRAAGRSLAGSLTPVPALDYARHLFWERSVRSVTANTRADGEELFEEAARIPVRPATTLFPLEEANGALALLKLGGFAGSGVLLTG
jgi:propanol-preferring alcohol dehydrogenase